MLELTKNEQAKHEFLYNNLRFGRYIDLLEKWKILRTSDLVKLCGDVPSSSVKRHLKQMSDLKMIQSAVMLMGSKEATHILTERYLAFSNSKLPESSLYHELTLNMFLVSFFNEFSQYIDDIYLAHEDREYSKKGGVEPDAVITLKTSSRKVVKLAIENEISQKSENRFLNKVITYNNSSDYDYVFYLFPTKKVFNSYYTICERRPEALKIFPDKILFMCLPDLVRKEVGCGLANVYNPKYKIELEKLVKESVNGK